MAKLSASWRYRHHHRLDNYGDRVRDKLVLSHVGGVLGSVRASALALACYTLGDRCFHLDESPWETRPKRRCKKTKRSTAGVSKIIGIGIIAFVALASIVVAFAVSSWVFHNSAVVGQFTVTLDNVSWSPNTSMDWGIFTPGQMVSRTLNVTNGYNAPEIVTLLCDLPSGWNETWTSKTDGSNLNGTSLANGQIASGWLNVTASSTAASGSYPWDMTLPLPG